MNETPEGWTFEDLREALDDYQDPGTEFLSAQEWATAWQMHMDTVRQKLNEAVEKGVVKKARRRGIRGDGRYKWFTVYAPDR